MFYQKIAHSQKNKFWRTLGFSWNRNKKTHLVLGLCKLNFQARLTKWPDTCVRRVSQGRVCYFCSGAHQLRLLTVVRGQGFKSCPGKDLRTDLSFPMGPFCILTCRVCRTSLLGLYNWYTSGEEASMFAEQEQSWFWLCLFSGSAAALRNAYLIPTAKKWVTPCSLEYKRHFSHICFLKL